MWMPLGLELTVLGGRLRAPQSHEQEWIPAFGRKSVASPGTFGFYVAKRLFVGSACQKMIKTGVDFMPVFAVPAVDCFGHLLEGRKLTVRIAIPPFMIADDGESAVEKFRELGCVDRAERGADPTGWQIRRGR